MAGGLQLNAVEIQNFKKIRKAAFDIGLVNVLVGANNAGKSSAIQGLHFAISILQVIELKGKFPRISNKDVTITLAASDLIYAPTDDIYSLCHGSRLREHQDSFVQFKLTLGDGEIFGIKVKKGRNQNILVTVDNPAVAQKISKLNDPFTIFSPGLAGVAKVEGYVSDGVLLRALARGDANLVLRNILLRLSKKNSEWLAFCADLHEIFPELKIKISFDEEIDEYIVATVSRNGVIAPLESSGTGILQAMQILSYIHLFSPRLIVLDEPDSHLHPNNQRLLCNLLAQVAEERDTQVLMTTHSRHVVDSVEGEAGFLWAKSGAIDQASKEDELGVLMDIGALDIKERAGVEGTKLVVLTEDTLTKPLEVLLEASGFDKTTMAVLSYHGVTSMKQLSPLIVHIRSTNPNVKILLHRDRDYLQDKDVQNWETSVRAQKVEPFVTKGTDVESHFTEMVYLKSQLPSVLDADWQRIWSEIKEETLDKNTEKFINSRNDFLRKQGKAGSINVGKIGTEANKLLAANYERWRHGKTTLAALRQKLSELGHNLPQNPCDELQDATLLAVAAKL